MEISKSPSILDGADVTEKLTGDSVVGKVPPTDGGLGTNVGILVGDNDGDAEMGILVGDNVGGRIDCEFSVFFSLPEEHNPIPQKVPTITAATSNVLKKIAPKMIFIQNICSSLDDGGGDDCENFFSLW